MKLNCLLAALLVALAACSRNEREASPDKSRQPEAAAVLRIGTAPPGGTFNVMGEALAEVLGEAKPGKFREVVALDTAGSYQNIEMLNQGQLELALANAATSYFAAQQGHGVRAVMTLAPNIGMFVTRKDSGIKGIGDLNGKRVAIGPAGAGFEFFLIPIFVAHDASFKGIQPVFASQSESVRMLAAKEIDAAFLGGAVPTESITQACELMNIHFIPFEPVPSKVLRQEFIFFTGAKIPAGTYKGLDKDFECLNVGSMHLVTREGMDEKTVYQITRAIYENGERIAKKHPAGKAINLKTAVEDTGIPFHPGAVKFYKEIGIWAERQ